MKSNLDFSGFINMYSNSDNVENSCKRELWYRS